MDNFCRGSITCENLNIRHQEYLCEFEFGPVYLQFHKVIESLFTFSVCSKTSSEGPSSVTI